MRSAERIACRLDIQRHSAFRTPPSALECGASGRTRTDEYEFTKLVLWLLRHRGKVASTAGIAPATSTFARWRSDLTELRGQNGIRDRTCTD
jgi:hypothetical protein